MSSTFDALHESVRSWIGTRGWTHFTSIQDRAIPAILSGHGALLVAPTAGGKTEAALLPIVSALLADPAPPISLLYIAPLRALINDQTDRAERMLRDTSLRCEWWHGDLSHAKRLAIAKNLPDVLLTTPESLEVHLSSPTYGHGALLGNVRFVLIDEVHAFATDPRGAQLVSLLQRLEATMRRPILRVALSATIGNPATVAQWLQSPRPDAPDITVLEEAGPKQRELHAGLIAVTRRPGESKEERERRERERIRDVVARHVAGRRSIVFVTSRAEAETLTVDLRVLGIDALIHHGSLSVELRRAAEQAMKRDEPKVIVATSTLELGIDIGDLEQVVQIGAVGTVSAWLQRIGRSGRSEDAISVGFMYALEPGELPRVLALCDLARTSSAEPIIPDQGDLGIAFHQILNLLRERDRLRRDQIIATLRQAGSLRGISTGEWEVLIDEMLGDEYLEMAADLVQLGPATEQTFGFGNYRDFYSVFRDDSGWSVKHGATLIGSLAADYPLAENRETKFVLAGKWWRVLTIDQKAMVVTVEPIDAGSAPTWRSGIAETSFDVMQRAAAILAGEITPLMSDGLQEHLAALQLEARENRVLPRQIVVGEMPSGVELVTYCGERINRYLGALIAGSSASESVQPTVTVKADAIRIGGLAATAADVAKVLDDLLHNPVQRAEAEATAVDVLVTPTFGKYGQYLGPQSRRAAWRSHFRAVSRLDDVASFTVVTRSSEGGH